MPNPFATTAGSFGVGAAALGALGATGLFGGGGTVANPYEGQATNDFTGAQGAINGELGGGLNLEHTGENVLGQYGSFLPEANQATEQELQYLQTNPYTDTYDQAQIAQGTSHAMQGFAAAKSALASDLGQRGLASPGGASSALTGANAAIDAQEAGTLAGQQNNLALDAIAQRARNLQLAQQIAQEHAGQLFSEGTSATEGGANVLGSAAGQYDANANDWLGMGQQQIEDTQNANNAASSSWAGLAGIGMKVAGL